MGYLYIAASIVLTVYGQLILKWQVGLAGPAPEALPAKLLFLLGLLLNPWVLSGFFAAFAASLSWMAAIGRFELSHAYPLMSLSFVLVLLLAGLLFNEPITAAKLIGAALIVLGVFVGSRG